MNQTLPSPLLALREQGRLSLRSYWQRKYQESQQEIASAVQQLTVFAGTRHALLQSYLDRVAIEGDIDLDKGEAILTYRLPESWPIQCLSRRFGDSWTTWQWAVPPIDEDDLVLSGWRVLRDREEIYCATLHAALAIAQKEEQL